MCCNLCKKKNRAPCRAVCAKRQDVIDPSPDTCVVTNAGELQPIGIKPMPSCDLSPDAVLSPIQEEEEEEWCSPQGSLCKKAGGRMSAINLPTHMLSSTQEEERVSPQGSLCKKAGGRMSSIHLPTHVLSLTQEEEPCSAQGTLCKKAPLTCVVTMQEEERVLPQGSLCKKAGGRMSSICLPTHVLSRRRTAQEEDRCSPQGNLCKKAGGRMSSITPLARKRARSSSALGTSSLRSSTLFSRLLKPFCI